MRSEMSIDLEYKLRYGEMLHAMLYNWFFTFRYARYFVFGIVFMGIGLFSSLDESFKIVAFILGIIYITSPIWWCPFMVWRQMRETKDKESVRIRIDGERLHLSSGDASSESFIGELSKVKESSGSLLLYLDSTFYIIVPKRVFDNEQEIAQFSGFAKGLVRT